MGKVFKLGDQGWQQVLDAPSQPSRKPHGKFCNRHEIILPKNQLTNLDTLLKMLKGNGDYVGNIVIQEGKIFLIDKPQDQRIKSLIEELRRIGFEVQ